MEFYTKKDFYKILGVNQNATQDEIKTAFRKLAKEFHPDLHSNNPLANLANEKFKEINEAYEVLSDESKRKEYDNLRLQNDNNSFRNTTSEKRETDTNNNYYNNKSQSSGQGFEREYKKQEYNKEKAKTTGRVKKEQACYKHSDRLGVENCSDCGVLLCEECAGLFSETFCINCIVKNNKIYLRRMIMPLILTIIIIITGFIAGYLLGDRYKVLSDNGILEGLILSGYLMCFGLYMMYIGQYVKKFAIYIVKVIDFIFPLSDTTLMFILELLVLLIGIAVGWIFGLLFGGYKLYKDVKSYKDFKPEHIKIKKYAQNKM